MGEILGRFLWTVGAIVGMFLILIACGVAPPEAWSTRFWFLTIGIAILANLLVSIRYSRGTGR